MSTLVVEVPGGSRIYLNEGDSLVLEDNNVYTYHDIVFLILDGTLEQHGMRGVKCSPPYDGRSKSKTRKHLPLLAATFMR